MQKFILLLFTILSFQSALAQFRVIDAATGEPLIGAYVLDEKGRFLEMSDNDGRVRRHEGQLTVSMLSYESQKVNGTTQTDDVALKQKPFTLGEAVVGKNDFMKTSGVFRDVVRFDGELVLYREGLVDFYYDCKKKKYTRRVRACRQFVASCMTSIRDAFKIPPINYDSFNFAKCVEVERQEVSKTDGDSTFYRVKGTDDAIVEINDTIRGLYRTILDDIKCKTAPINEFYKVFTKVNDWTYNSPERTLSSAVAYSMFTNFIYRSPFLKIKNPVGGKLPGMDVVISEEFVVTDFSNLTKEDAHREMKNKSETCDFALPNVLPALPFDVETETKDLKQTRFKEY